MPERGCRCSSVGRAPAMTGGRGPIPSIGSVLSDAGSIPAASADHGKANPSYVEYRCLVVTPTVITGGGVTDAAHGC